MGTGVIEITGSIKVDGKWFLMGHQFCYTGTEMLSVQISCDPECYRDKLHYVVVCNDVTYKITSEYAVVVDEMKSRDQFDRQEYARKERLAGDDTTDFIGKTKEILGIQTGYYCPDIKLDDEIERKLGYR